MTDRRIGSRLEALNRRIGRVSHHDYQATLRRAQERLAVECGITVEQVIVDLAKSSHLTIEEILANPDMAGVSRQQLIDEANRLMADEEVFHGAH